MAQLWSNVLLKRLWRMVSSECQSPGLILRLRTPRSTVAGSHVTHRHRVAPSSLHQRLSRAHHILPLEAAME